MRLRGLLAISMAVGWVGTSSAAERPVKVKAGGEARYRLELRDDFSFNHQSGLAGR